MPRTLTQLLPPTRSGRTFLIASSLLGLGALSQLGVLAWYFAHGGARNNLAASAQAATAASAPRFAETMQPNVASMELPAPTPAVPQMADRATVDLPGADSATLLPRPTPALGERLPGAASTDALEQARSLRQRGDMRAALSRLREALVAEPDNPQVLAELALTYEAMQLAEKAFEQWQRIYGMGESVGALYYLADAKLHGSASTTGNGSTPTRRPGSPSAVDSTVLKLTSVSAEPLPDPSAEEKVALKIVVKGLPGVVIDPEKVRIDANFYDLVDGKDVVQTNAQTDFEWLTPKPINWANDKSEVLEALYIRPKGVALMPSPAHATARRVRGGKKGATPEPEASPSPAAADGAAAARRYLGYSVRLYYAGQLQEVQADPVRLLQDFQAPLTLPEGSNDNNSPSAAAR